MSVSFSLQWLFLPWVLVCLLLGITSSSAIISCNRNPDTLTEKVPGDGGYKVMISGNPETYVPGEVYTVSLQGRRGQYSVQKFIGFMLVVDGVTAAYSNLYGPQSVGTFQLYGDILTRHSPDCPNAVVQTSNSPKSEIQVLWTAPPAGSGCVRFRAMIQESRDRWFMDDGELSKELCEEVPETFDLQPETITDCCACDEAKYEVTFEGLWSRHTHPKKFPANEWLTHFSDIIGASHSNDYRVWEVNSYARNGLRQVAEWGSTRSLESELKSQSDHIRTIIKARGLWHPNLTGKTFAVFRVDNTHHLMSLVSMIGPSPDWIVGVSAMELCLKNCSWITHKTVNLYPYDVGTDSGISYESSPMATIPRQRISRITNSFPANEESPFYDPRGLPMKPLARLTVSRQRVYEKSCSDPSQPSSYGGAAYESSDEDAQRPECAVTEYGEFSPCSASCGKGLRARTRSYLMPSKAEMMQCRRQLEEKEMCVASISFCDEDIIPDIFGQALPIDESVCAMSSWTPWTSCTATCAEGFIMRTRHYLDRMGRKRCNEEILQKEPCYATQRECPTHEESEIVDPTCAVTPWSDWSPCSVTCATGVQHRTRQFLIPTSQQPDCNIELLQRRSCRSHREDCALDASEAEEVCTLPKDEGACYGEFPKWYYDVERQQCTQFIYTGCRGNRNRFDRYEECTELCEFNRDQFIFDNFSQTTPEHASYVQNQNGGHFSPTPGHHGGGNGASQRPNHPSPNHNRQQFPVDNNHNNYNNHNNQNNHHQHQQNHHQNQNSHGGPPPSLGAPANLQQGPPPPHHAGSGRVRVNCRVSPWGPWTACSTSCGRGHQEKHRTVLVHPQNGGRHCPRKLTRRRVCNKKVRCPNDLHGGLQSLSLTREDVYNAQQQPLPSNSYAPTPDPEEEFEMEYDGNPNSDCVMGDWSAWSPCTQSCGPEALQQRDRSIVSRPRGTGAPCGARLERRFCSLPPCMHNRG